MKETPNAIYMEPEEYEAYLKEQEEKQEKLKAYYESLKEGDSNVNGPSLYELNQQIIAKMPALDGDGVRDCSGKILKWLDTHPDPYYMLLCNELSYYTLFHVTSAKYNAGGNLMISRGAMRDLTDEILDIVANLGDVRVIEEDNNGAISVWSSLKPVHYEALSDEAKAEADIVHCFYLFPYGRGVVEV